VHSVAAAKAGERNQEVVSILDLIFGGIIEWLEDVLIGFITSGLEMMFQNVNNQVDYAAGVLTMTPMDYMGGTIFNMVLNIGENVIMVIGGVIVTFVMTYELIQMLLEKNNMVDFEVANIYKWIFKCVVIAFIGANVFNIVGAAFELGSWAVSGAAGAIGNTTAEFPDATAIAAALAGRPLGELIGIFFTVFIAGILFNVLSIALFIVTLGRMIEIYITIALAPIPLATLASREWGSMGNNYLKSILAVAFQGVLMMVCFGMYAAMIAGIAADLLNADTFAVQIWQALGLTVLLAYSLFKTGAVSRSIFGAH
jgi:mannose/fructose-specific phosphotransferase system component IIA